ncbi:transient receptor potential cation channel protein painless-like [Drosophila montana]|uniref:transient receptor potential cation channel protein painless-like n=1 Tax=Drosophila montana TaxID=40370 RepID=UPI00313C5E41
MDAEGVNAQLELRDAFEARDLARFRRALKQGAQPNVSHDESGQGMSIYEQALSTAGCSKFLTACLLAGCDINYVNPQLKKAAINYASDSKDASNLGALLDRHKHMVNADYLYKQETALLMLVKQLNGTEYENIVECIEKLISYGASPNIVDAEGKTPMQHLLQNTEVHQSIRIGLVYELLLMPKLNLANYGEGLEYVLQNKPNGNSPMLYKLLVRQLLSLNVDELLQAMARYEQEIDGWDKLIMICALLTEFRKNSNNIALNAIEAIMPTNQPGENQFIVEINIVEGDWTTVLCLLRLVQNKRLKLESGGELLVTLIKQDPPKLQRNIYQTCLQQLLRMDPKSCINVPDSHGYTLLHYAVHCCNEIAIRELLRQGAPLGLRNDRKKLLIEDIKMQLLEQHFDYCITSRGKKPSHESYEILLNFMNLTNEQHELDMAPIAYIASSKELCPLLKHPLITCFLLLKWRNLSRIFLTHFAVFLFFGISLVAHSLLCFPQRSTHELCIGLFCASCSLFILYMVMADLLAYLMVRDMPSPIDPPLVVLVLLTCLEWCEPQTQRIVSVLAIMLMACKLMLMIGALPVPGISTHMLMLRQVSRNFLVSLALYSILVLTFGLCFYIQFGQPQLAQSEDQSELFLTLSQLGRGFIQTLVMFTGQFEYKDFNSYSGSLVLLLFMFMCIVLTNLLSGLAVGDTQAIRAHVELNAAICRTDILSRYEAGLKHDWKYCKWLCGIFHKLAKIQTNVSYGYLSILPNQDNKALVYGQRHRNESLDKLPDSEDGASLRLFNPDHEDGDSISQSSEPDFLYNSQEDIEIGQNKNDNCIYPFEMSSEQFKELTIDHTTVKRALEIIQCKCYDEIKEEDEVSIENRLEDIWTLLQEQVQVLKETINNKTFR